MGKIHINRGGFCVASFYVLVVVLVYTFTSLTTKPSNVGYDWIPFVLLAMPWYGLARFLYLGLIINVGIAYLLGTLFDIVWCWIFAEQVTGSN